MSIATIVEKKYIIGKIYFFRHFDLVTTHLQKRF